MANSFSTLPRVMILYGLQCCSQAIQLSRTCTPMTLFLPSTCSVLWIAVNLVTLLLPWIYFLCCVIVCALYVLLSLRTLPLLPAYDASHSYGQLANCAVTRGSRNFTDFNNIRCLIVQGGAEVV